MAQHQHASSLIYAADTNFSQCTNFEDGWSRAWDTLGLLIKRFEGLGIVVKGNSLFRFMGGMSLKMLEQEGLRIFADYKFFDVQSTCGNDFSWLRLIDNVEVVTVSEYVHSANFQEAVAMMPEAIIAPVGPLTDLTDAEFERLGLKTRKSATAAFIRRVSDLPSTGMVCSPRDLELLPKNFAEGRCLITPGIRPDWATIKGDTNKVNALTPREAILAGADKLVVGSPIRHTDDWRGNALRVLDEIGEALIERNGV